MKPSNILKIETLNNNWRDKDSIILHACFQILSDCINKENLLDNKENWNLNEKNINTKKEIEILYQWWKNYNESNIPDNESHEKENEMLIRLIKIRWALWT